MRIQWAKLGGQLGVAFCLAGLLFIFFGWNGAASYDDVPAQFPYLISGGLAGVCLVVIGAGLLVVQNQRADRAQLQATIAQLQQAVERMAAASGGTAVTTQSGEVLAGPTSYHRPDCRLAEGRENVVAMPREAAIEQGLKPCRVCEPDAAGRRRSARAR